MDTPLAKATVTLEEHQAWLAHPVTQWVLEALEVRATEQQQAWVLASWDQGVSDGALLTELRTRADAYRAVAETEYPALCEVLGQEPVAE